MFVGKYYNSIDSKSRVIVPAKFRLELGGRCIVAKALDKCLTVYPFEQWEKFVNEKLELLPDSNPQARRLKRHFLSSAAECDVDKQGRLTIPQELKEYAGIELDQSKKKKPSVRKKLQKTKERKAKQRQRVKTKQKVRGQER